MRDIQMEFFVRVSRTSFLDGELGSSVMGLTLDERDGVGVGRGSGLLVCQ